jgi:exodeoxyribonuclease-3
MPQSLVSWNVNGIRAAQKAGFLKWFSKDSPDVVCVQETKAKVEQLEEEMLHPEGYHSYWHSAEKPGYSGVAIYSKKEPLEIRYGIGDPEIDREGRVLIADYAHFTLLNAYFPNSQREHTRLPYKLAFCKAMLTFLERTRKSGKNIVLCGDFNIAHKPIDLANPKQNEKNAGYLPEERSWMEGFVGEKSHGYIDVFRQFQPGPGHYTWWSYRPGVREKNIGWRLDYFVTNPEFKSALKSCAIFPQIKGSDHCPVRLELK